MDDLCLPFCTKASTKLAAKTSNQKAHQDPSQKTNNQDKKIFAMHFPRKTWLSLTSVTCPPTSRSDARELDADSIPSTWQGLPARPECQTGKDVAVLMYQVKLTSLRVFRSKFNSAESKRYEGTTLNRFYHSETKTGKCSPGDQDMRHTAAQTRMHSLIDQHKRHSADA